MKLHWLLYVLLLLGLGVGQTAHKLITDTGGLLSQYGPVTSSLIVTFGLVAACLDLPIFRSWVWKAVSSLLIAGALGLVVLAIHLVVIAAPISIIALPLGGIVLLMPALWKLFVYAFRSPHVWIVPTGK